MSKNDITGDRLVSKVPSAEYRDNFDSIFSKRIKPETTQEAYEQGVVDGRMFQIKKEVDRRIGCQGGKCKHASDCAVHDSESDGRCDCDESWPFEQDTSVPKPPAPYTAEELERDNPYNQWMNEE